MINWTRVRFTRSNHVLILPLQAHKYLTSRTYASQPSLNVSNVVPQEARFLTISVTERSDCELWCSSLIGPGSRHRQRRPHPNGLLQGQPGLGAGHQTGLCGHQGSHRQSRCVHLFASNCFPPLFNFKCQSRGLRVSKRVDPLPPVFRNPCWRGERSLHGKCASGRGRPGPHQTSLAGSR